jgi:hypothetical protein
MLGRLFAQKLNLIARIVLYGNHCIIASDSQIVLFMRVADAECGRGNLSQISTMAAWHTTNLLVKVDA